MLLSRIKYSLLPLTLLLSTAANADQFHYSNLLIGDRAIGMAGAYGGVSDDASGVFYNPGGLAFALSNDVSGSANAIHTKTVTYKGVMGGEDYVEKSGGTTPSFFGGLQKLDHLSKGLVFAFGLYTTDAELRNQDTLIENVDLEIEKTAGTSKSKQRRFHQTINMRGSTNYIGGALAKRFGNNFSLGLGINYVQVDELVQDYQDSVSQSYEADGTTLKNQVNMLAQNLRQHLLASGIQVVLGSQLAIGGKFSVGLTVKGGMWLNNTLDSSFEKTVVAVTAADADTMESTPGAIASSKTQRTLITKEYDDAIGSFAVDTRLGFAYFASPRLLMSLDASYFAPVTDAADEISTFWNKEDVINIATGLEYYVMPSLPVRMGFFTNNDARPKVEEGEQGQVDHVDYMGGTIFLGWVQPNSQISGGLIAQQGKGKSQKIGGLNVQDVEATALAFAFSATHSF